MIGDFHDLLAAFVAAGVRFVVVGAHALAAYGVPRVTGDLDIWVEPTPVNAGRVWQALAAFIRNKRATGRPKDLADIEALGG